QFGVRPYCFVLPVFFVESCGLCEALFLLFAERGSSFSVSSSDFIRSLMASSTARRSLIKSAPDPWSSLFTFVFAIIRYLNKYSFVEITGWNRRLRDRCFPDDCRPCYCQHRRHVAGHRVSYPAPRESPFCQSCRS